VELVFRWIKIGLAFLPLVDQKRIGENIATSFRLCGVRMAMEKPTVARRCDHVGEYEMRGGLFRFFGSGCSGPEMIYFEPFAGPVCPFPDLVFMIKRV